MGLLDGKVAVVTGAGHGIGRGHALELAKQGARVVVNDLGSSVHGEGAGRDADVTVGLIAQRGGEAIADYGDVGDDAEAGLLIDRAVSEWGSSTSWSTTPASSATTRSGTWTPPTSMP